MAVVSSFPAFSPLPTLSLHPSRSKQRISRFPIKCSSSPKLDSESKTLAQSGISAFTWSAGLGALGLAETGYLTYLKLTNTAAAFCPVGGGSCSDILNSDYAVVFGVPLPLIGLLGYGLVTTLTLQLSGGKRPFGLSESDGRLILLGTTTALATASGYFLYLLGTKFSGTTCSYCLFSALLSFTLFFINLKDYGWEGLLENIGIQLTISAIVVAALSNTYSTAQSDKNLVAVDLLPFESEITNQSTPFSISLANHLRSIGAKMYGAFWCSHCLEQKEMFGSEAAKVLDYVECFPDGVGKGRKIAKECEIAKIEGFPTWVIKGKVYDGELTFPELIDASGFIE